MSVLGFCFLVILGIILFIPILYGIIHKLEITIMSRSDFFALINFCFKSLLLFSAIVLTDGIMHQSDWEPYANREEVEIHQTKEKSIEKKKPTAKSTIEHILVTWSK